MCGAQIISFDLFWTMLRMQVNDENNAYSSNVKQIIKDTPSIKKKGLNIVSANAVKHQSCFDNSSKTKAGNSLLDCPKESYFPPSSNGWLQILYSLRLLFRLF